MAEIRKIEIGILLVLATYFLFAATNVNQTLGTIYGIFAIATMVFIMADPKRSIPFRKQNDSLLGSIAIGAFAYIVLIIIGTWVVIPTIDKIINLLGATTPALASSPIFNFLSFAVAVPFAETMFFFMVAYDVWASLWNVDIDRRNLKNIKLWVMMIVISVVFMLFHLTAKGIQNASILGLVFVMAMISMLLITWFKSGEQAIYFHVVANAIPSLSMLGIKLLGA